MNEWRITRFLKLVHATDNFKINCCDHPLHATVTFYSRNDPLLNPDIDLHECRLVLLGG